MYFKLTKLHNNSVFRGIHFRFKLYHCVHYDIAVLFFERSDLLFKGDSKTRAPQAYRQDPLPQTTTDL